MDLDAFVGEHSAAWRRLEQLTRRRRLSAAEVDELLGLYQRTGTHLSVVRSTSPDPALVAWLSRIVLAARGRLRAGKVPVWRSVGQFFTQGFPLAVYQARRWWLAVGALFVAGSVATMTYLAAHPEVRAKLLPPEEAQQLVQHDFAGYYRQYPAQHFALEVWTNNALLTGEALAAGILIVPAILLLAQNMLNVGVVGGFMLAGGRGTEFFGLIAPHGLLELTAVFIGAGAGLRIGWAWIAPGPGRTRGLAVGQTAREAMLVALGLVVVLAISGGLEAFVTPSPLPIAARIGIGALAWAAFLGYVLVFGSRAAAAQASADLEVDLDSAQLPSV